MKAHKKLSILPALLVAFLSLGGFVGAMSIASKNQVALVPVSFAGEDDGDDEEDDKDEDKEDDKESKSEKDAKKKAEKEREDAKKRAEKATKSSNDDNDDEDDDMVNGVKVRGDGSMDDDEDDSKEGEDEYEDGDNNGMYKDRAKTLAKLAEELAETEKDILEKQAEGVDVTLALARLAEAKAKVAGVGTAFDANDLETAKDLSQEIKKMAHFAKENDLHDAKEIAEDVAKVSKRITQTYGKISLLEAVGGDGTQLKEALVLLEADLATLKATIATGGYNLESTENALETLERKVKMVKNSAEAAIYALGGTDSRYDDDYEDETEDIVKSLKDVADIEDDSVGRSIRHIAEEQEDSVKRVSEAVTSVDNRNPVLQTLLGASGADLRELEAEITANKTRIDMLTQAANAINDPEVKTILLDQVAILQEQTTKLETFVSGQKDRLSVFGWVFNLFK